MGESFIRPHYLSSNSPKGVKQLQQSRTSLSKQWGNHTEIVVANMMEDDEAMLID